MKLLLLGAASELYHVAKGYKIAREQNLIFFF